MGQGNANSIAGDYDKAIADFNEAIRLDPKSTLVFIGRAMLIRTEATTTARWLITTRRSNLPQERSRA
jgi:hypothetical protein